MAYVRTATARIVVYRAGAFAAALLLALLLLPFLLRPASAVGPERYFDLTGYSIPNDAIWNYFQRRGGVKIFGYPVSREFYFLGQRTQFFQRLVVQQRPDGSVQTLNLLDEGLMPYTRINGSTFPDVDADLKAQTPSPDNPDYATAIVDFVRAVAPDAWNGQPVNFGSTFLTTVSYEDAFPEQDGSPALMPLIDLEIWGAPTSRPAPDPANRSFVYQRFQRGIMHYDASNGTTQGLLLADYFKAIITGENLPADLAEQARESRFFQQYDNSLPGAMRRPWELPDSNLENAFEPDRNTAYTVPPPLAAAPPRVGVKWVYYRDEWREPLVTGQTRTASVTLRNDGTVPWLKEGTNVIQLGYQWYRDEAGDQVAASGEPAPLPSDVPAGEVVVVNLPVRTPDLGGSYRLVFDLLQGGATWLSQLGVSPLVRHYTVVSQQASQPGAPQVAWQQVDLPTDLAAGETYTAHVEAINVGSTTWSSAGDSAVFVSYHWYDTGAPTTALGGKGQAALRLARALELAVAPRPAAQQPGFGRAVVWEGIRSPLPRDILPGDRLVMDLPVRTPDQAGTYLIVFDLVQDDGTWSSCQQAPGAAAILQRTVRPPIAPPSTPPLARGSVAFAADWPCYDFPTSPQPNQTYPAHVVVRNIGTAPWPAGGATPVRLSYHWLSADGSQRVVWDGLRTRLAADLPPGGTLDVTMQVRTPDQPGSYLLQFDVVQEGVGWFSHNGVVAPSLPRQVSGESVPQPPTSTPTATPPPGSACTGDERITFSPGNPQVGQTVLITVTSSKRHRDVRLEGPWDPEGPHTREDSGGATWQWQIVPQRPGRYDYSFFVEGSTLCTTNFVRVEETPPPQAPTSTPTPTALPPTRTPSPTASHTPQPACPRLTVALSARPQSDGTVQLRWAAEGGCEPYAGTLSGRYEDRRQAHFNAEVEAASGRAVDQPPSRCEGSFRLVYTIDLHDGSGQRARDQASAELLYVC